MQFFILGQEEVRAHHIGICRPMASMTSKFSCLDEECYLRNLGCTLIQINTEEVVLHNHLRNITTAIVTLVVFHLIYIQVVEERESINQEVARTAGGVEQSHLAQVLGMAHLMVRYIGYLVLLFDTAVGEHLHICLTQRIVNKELHYPLGRINLTLKRHLIIFCLLATLLQCFFLYGIEVLVEPAKDVVTLPYISSTVSIRFYGIELLDNLIQFIGSW